jgi:hypothetical protein
MSLQITCDKEFKLVKTGKYRLEGDDLFPIGDSVLKVTTALMTIEEGTIILVDKLNINEYHPDMFRGYIPSLNAYIVAISFIDVITA